MMRWQTALVITAGVLLPVAATADPCFEIITPPATVAPYDMVKINKCTGESWILVKAGIPKSKGQQDDPYTWRWYPLTHADGEAVMLPQPAFSPAK